MDLRLLKSSDTSVTFELGDHPRLVSGVEALVQQVIVELLSDYSPLLGRGSGLKTIVETAAPSDITTTRSLLSTAISSAKANILACQNSANELLPSERLKDLKTIKIQPVNDFEWLIEIEVETFSGDLASRSVTI